MFKLVTFSVLIIAALSAIGQDVPIPATVEGYSRGSNNPTLHIEAYYDLLCPDSQASWNILEPLLNFHYNINTNQTLRFTIHLFPLPFHINSFLVTQGAKVIADQQTHPTDIFTYFNLMFQLQSSFAATATVGMTQKAIQDLLTSKVTSAFPYLASTFENGLTYGNNYDSDARTTWKFAANNRITGTPRFYANGVEIDGSGSYTSANWQSFLDGGYTAVLREHYAKKLKSFDL